MRQLIICVIICLLLSAHDLIGQQNAATPIYGFVDMHTHPRSDLAFGTELFYGAPYGDMAVELLNCKADHDGWGRTNKHCNTLRSKLAEKAENQYSATWVDKRAGYPDFSSWPSWCSVLHQQMWVDWIERAHQGGLNIMVALATNSHCIAHAAQTKGPYDDEYVMTSCIQGIKDLAAHSTFMEIALTPQDVRRIVASCKLAIILGIEMDNIGNFYKPADDAKGNFNPTPTDQQVQDELDKIWSMGVRYIFPVHLTNNALAGAAIYMSVFDVTNKFNTGAEFIPEKISTQESGIAYHLDHPITTLSKIDRMVMGLLVPRSVNPAKKKNYTFWDLAHGYGHRNSMGLTDRGRFAIRYMMRKGFLIDIDHMSDKSATETLDIATRNDYPLNSGHNDLRGNAGNENGRTVKQYTQLIALGGMIGIGHGDSATDFVHAYREVLGITGSTPVGIGTDVDGFYPLPHRDASVHVVYDSTLTRCRAGNRTWDINTDGFAHYGLFPDFIRSCELAGMSPTEKKAFMNSAEQFTRMWEKCEARKAKFAD